jgi:hypothetical protein
MPSLWPTDGTAVTCGSWSGYDKVTLHFAARCGVKHRAEGDAVALAGEDEQRNEDLRDVLGHRGVVVFPPQATVKQGGCVLGPTAVGGDVPFTCRTPFVPAEVRLRAAFVSAQE